jgi:hypothetical protein
MRLPCYDAPVTTTINRADVREVLLRWQRQELSHACVHDWATARYAVSAFECDNEVTNEVLAALDMLDVKVTTDADIPCLLKALDAVSGDEASSIMASMPYDREERRQRFGNDPVYRPFLRKAEG